MRNWKKVPYGWEMCKSLNLFIIFNNFLLGTWRKFVSSLAREWQLCGLCKQGKNIKIYLPYNQQRTDECTMNEWI